MQCVWVTAFDIHSRNSTLLFVGERMPEQQDKRFQSELHSDDDHTSFFCKFSNIRTFCNCTTLLTKDISFSFVCVELFCYST